MEENTEARMRNALSEYTSIEPKRRATGDEIDRLLEKVKQRGPDYFDSLTIESWYNKDDHGVRIDWTIEVPDDIARAAGSKWGAIFSMGTSVSAYTVGCDGLAEYIAEVLQLRYEDKCDSVRKVMMEVA